MYKKFFLQFIVLKRAYDLSVFDLLSNKKRSYLNFTWIIFGFTIFIFLKSYIFSILLNINFKTYIYFLSISIMNWIVISSLITDAPKIFRKKIIKDTVLPNNFFVFHLLCEKFIIYSLNFLLPLFLIFYLDLYEIRILNYIFNILIFFLLFYYLIFNISALGVLNKDIDFFLQTTMKVFFFLTPIIWTPNKIPETYQIYINLNPFYHLIEFLRNPLLDKDVNEITYIFIFFGFLLNFILYKFFFKKILINAPKYI